MAIFVAVPLTAVTIALAWSWYRPFFALGLLATASFFMSLVAFIVRKTRKAEYEYRPVSSQVAPWAGSEPMKIGYHSAHGFSEPPPPYCED